jgi:3-hydroxybutyryl-CoA dehydratase
MRINDFKIGMKETTSCIMSDTHIKTFANLSGDFNPIHISEEKASKSIWKRRVCHGLLSASLFSGLFGTRLPGPGSVYVSQNLKFLRPVYIDDEVNATIEVLRINEHKKRITFKTTCSVNNKIVISGKAEILLP